MMLNDKVISIIAQTFKNEELKAFLSLIKWYSVK
jgi:hypothetical protein